MKNTSHLVVKFQHLLIYCGQKNKDNLIYVPSMWQKNRDFFALNCACLKPKEDIQFQN